MILDDFKAHFSLETRAHCVRSIFCKAFSYDVVRLQAAVQKIISRDHFALLALRIGSDFGLHFYCLQNIT